MPRLVAQTLASELNPAEQACVLGYLQSPGFSGPCLEVGTAAGGTLCVMMAGCQSTPRPKFVVVDNMQYFENQLAAVKENVRQHGLNPEEVDFRVGTSAEMFPQAEQAGEQFEFMLIDACHKIKQVTQDLRWTRLLRVGGVVCLHDYGHVHEGVTLAADRFLKRNPNYTREHLVGCLLALRKTAPSPAREISSLDLGWAMLRAPWLQLKASVAKRLRRRA